MSGSPERAAEGTAEVTFTQIQEPCELFDANPACEMGVDVYRHTPLLPRCKTAG